jgi:WD40 repeat protein
VRPTALAFAPDGKALAVGDEEGAIHLYDAESLRPVERLEWHRGAVSYVAFTPDGRRLVSVGPGAVRLWPWPLPAGE